MLIDDQNNIIPKSQFIGLIRLSAAAPETPTLSPQASERELYEQFISLSIHPSIASEGKQRRNEYTKDNQKEKKRLFETSELFDRRMVTKINHRS